MTRLAIETITTPFGPFSLVMSDDGLVATGFRRAGDLADTFRLSVEPMSTGAGEAFAAYFAGDRTSIETPLDWRFVRSTFHREVLETCAAIPYGSTMSYGELATKSGHSGAARAVGRAMATNPLCVVVPCHRVLAAGGAIGGYGGGLPLKRWLPGGEGVDI